MSLRVAKKNRWAGYCLVLGLALGLLLDACTTTRQPSNLPAHSYSQSIDISGRFSAQFMHNEKPESWSGSFTWTQTPEATSVALLSPLGQTIATIDIDNNGATLTQSDKEPHHAANVDALVVDTLGWPLPISNLRDWLQAYAVTADGKRITVTPETTATIATRDGWRLNYSSWQDDSDVNMQDVPKRIDMERDTNEAGRVQMRLVISTWQPH